MMRLEPMALGQRPPLQEGAEVSPPPAAVDRAQTVFEMTGIILLLLIAFGCVWFLLRRRP